VSNTHSGRQDSTGFYSLRIICVRIYDMTSQLQLPFRVQTAGNGKRVGKTER